MQSSIIIINTLAESLLISTSNNEKNILLSQFYHELQAKEISDNFSLRKRR